MVAHHQQSISLGPAAPLLHMPKLPPTPSVGPPYTTGPGGPKHDGDEQSSLDDKQSGLDEEQSGLDGKQSDLGAEWSIAECSGAEQSGRRNEQRALRHTSDVQMDSIPHTPAGDEGDSHLVKHKDYQRCHAGCSAPPAATSPSTPNAVPSSCDIVPAAHHSTSVSLIVKHSDWH